MKYVITTRGLRPLASADLTATIAKRAGDENAAPQGGGGVTMDGAKLFRSIKKRYRDDPGAALEAMVKKAITDARHTLRAAAKAAA